MQLTTMPGLQRGNGSRSASVRLLSAEETSRDEPNSQQPRARQDSIISNGEETTIVRRGSNISISSSLPLQQGVVLLEDAIHYRSIHHKLDSFSIRLYRWYHSAPVQWSLYAVIFVLMFLAFLETPSSLTWSSDPRQNLTRYEFPDGLLEGIDFACLFMLLISTCIQSYLIADLREKMDFPRKHPWLTGNFIVILLSFVDLLVSLNLGNDVYRLRFRRILRPYFLASSSTMLKKTLKCIRNTLPELASVLTLLLLHVYFFVMLGMLCFPKGGHSIANQTDSELNDTEWRSYFSSLDNAFMSLLVLLTTANNPDVMMPAYSENRLYSIYFIVFSLFGTFLIFNLLTAIVYNQFRGYFQNSMQASHIRRCVAFSAAFTVLSDTVSQSNGTNINSSSSEPNERVMYMSKLRVALSQVTMKPAQRTAIHHNIINLGVEAGITKDDFDQIFSNIDSSVALEILQPASVLEISTHAIRSKIQHVVLHPAFNIIGNLMVLVNAVIVTIEIAIHYETAFKEVFSRLNILNYGFAVYYVIEQSLKVTALGKKYFKNVACVYDGMITVALVIIETLQLGRYGWRTDYDNVGGISLWDCARIINILVILRLLRIIPNFKPMAVVTTTLLEIMKNLSSFAGVLAIIYYVFAIIGMMVFEKATDPYKISRNGSQQITCGTYEQLQYWANNFDDFASSLVVLWDVMVVNNWGVFLDAYSRHVGEASQLYFVIWWEINYFGSNLSQQPKMPMTDARVPTPAGEGMEVDLESDPRAAEERKQAGNEFYKAKKYADAIKEYSAAIELDPKNASYYGNRSAAYMMDSNYKRALEDAQTSVKIDPAFAKGFLREGKCHIALGNAQAALLALQKAKELEPETRGIMTEVQNARVLAEYEKRAEECLAKRDFRQVVFCMERASQVAPACIGYKMRKAECLASLARYNEAQSIAMDVLQRDSTNADAVYVRALCLYYDDNIDKAVNFFIHALRLSPDLTKARLTLKKAKALAAKKAEGNAAYKSGKHQEALEIYEEALKIDENNIKTNAKLRYNKALVSSKIGKKKEAIEDCTIAIQLDKDYVKAYLKRAQLYTDEEEYEEAVRDYKRVYQMEHTREHKRLVDEAERRLKMSQRKDYYKILGVSKTATDTELKKAYRKRALLHHPDRHSHDTPEVQKEEEKKFKEIGEAFAILSDPKKRDRFDRGEDIDGPSMGDFDPSNIFQMFFGGGGGGGPGGFHFQSGGPGDFHFQFG